MVVVVARPRAVLALGLAGPLRTLGQPGTVMPHSCRRLGRRSRPGWHAMTPPLEAIGTSRPAAWQLAPTGPPSPHRGHHAMCGLPDLAPRSRRGRVGLLGRRCVVRRRAHVRRGRPPHAQRPRPPLRCAAVAARRGLCASGREGCASKVDASTLALVHAVCWGIICTERPSMEAWATSVAQLVRKPSQHHAWLAGWRPTYLAHMQAELLNMVLRTAMDHTLRPLPPFWVASPLRSPGHWGGGPLYASSRWM